MNKFDYLFEAFGQRAYIRKTFLLSIFSLVHPTEKNNANLRKCPYAMFRDPDTRQVYFYRGDEKVIIEHPEYDKPLFHKNERLTVSPEINGWIDEKFETTVGLFLVNMVVLMESLGEAGSYLNGQITGNTIKGVIDRVMVDNPKNGEVVPKGKASVDQCLQISKNLDYLEGMNQVFVKASSIDVFTVHPEVIALRDRLLKELEEQGKLDDPTAVATVIDEVVALDAKIQYSGPSKDFFINGKFIDNARKKMFIIFDMVPDFHTGKYKLLRNSLDEGWDKKHFPAYINTAISASFDRGNATGEGGAEVKLAILLTNRMLAINTDCGTTRTERIRLTKLNTKGWIGGYYISKGEVVKFTGAKDGPGEGDYLDMRVPQYCTQPDGNLCRVCCGEKLGAIPERLSPETVFIFTAMMLTRMKGMHVSQLKTVTVDLKIALK